MNKRAFSTTLLVLLLLQTAQAQITVRALAPAGTAWQMDSTISEIPVSTPTYTAPVATEVPQLSFDPDALNSSAKSEQAECTSWQCSNYAKTPSAAQQIQTIQSQITTDETVTSSDSEYSSSNITYSGAVPSKLSYADKLMRHRRVGLGFRDNLCGVGLRNTFEKAGLFKRGISRSNSTALWHPYLVKQGFKNMGKNSPYCKVPGVIRLYNSSQISKKEMRRRHMKRTKGDDHGHIEFLGTNGKFYAAAESNTSRDTQLAPGRRPLIGCYVKTSEVE